MTRWTKNACEDLPEHLKIYKARTPILDSTTFRHTTLFTTALDIVKMGDSNLEAFSFAMSRLSVTRDGLKEIVKEQDGKGIQDVLDKENMDVQQSFNSDTSLKSSMIVERRKREWGRPTNARSKPAYEVSNQEQSSAKLAAESDTTQLNAQQKMDQTRSKERIPGVVSVACLVTLGCNAVVDLNRGLDDCVRQL